MAPPNDLDEKLAAYLGVRPRRKSGSQYELTAALTPTVAKVVDPDEVDLQALKKFFLDGEHSTEQLKALEDVVDAAAGKV